MAITVNTNVASLNAQRNLTSTQGALSLALQRLSSGLRVNSAKDDASGLAVAEGLSALVRGNAVAIRNANDGISAAQTAEGALSTVAGNLQRIREIAVQAANGSISSEQRTNLQKEVDQLTQEISRTIQSTSFNGISLLKGGSVSYQIGANDTDVVSVELSDLTGVSNTTVSTTTYNQFAPVDSNLDPLSVYEDVSGTATQVNQVYKATTTQTATQLLNAYNNDTSETQVIDVTTQDLAKQAIGKMDADIALITGTRATFGAVQNRFDAIISGLQVYKENLDAARARIMDADFAVETSNLTRAQILQQAGTAILAQANALPQNALTLLR